MPQEDLSEEAVFKLWLEDRGGMPGVIQKRGEGTINAETGDQGTQYCVFLFLADHVSEPASFSPVKWGQYQFLFIGLSWRLSKEKEREMSDTWLTPKLLPLMAVGRTGVWEKALGQTLCGLRV